MGGEAMTDGQLEFITWLITTATDKCQTVEEVREMNEQIRQHTPRVQRTTRGSQEEKKPES